MKNKNEQVRKLNYINNLINKKQKQIENLQKFIDNPESKCINSYNIGCSRPHSEEREKEIISEFFGLNINMFSVTIEETNTSTNYMFSLENILTIK